MSIIALEINRAITILSTLLPRACSKRVTSCLLCYLLVQGRTDQAADATIKKVLLDSCDVNADKVLYRT